jgi:AraC-like DNA-binding protein
MPMRYEEFPPPPDLVDFVAAAWAFQAGDGSSVVAQVPPDDGVSIAFVRHAGLMRLVGPHRQARRLPMAGGSEVWGVRLQPAAPEPLLGVSPGLLRELTVPLEAHAPGLAAQLGGALAGVDSAAEAAGVFARELRPLVRAARPLDRTVAAAALLIAESHGAVPIAEVAAASRLSGRQLCRRFAAATGLTPKEFARIRRLRAAVTELVLEESVGLADLAGRSGYADKAHFSRDVTAAFGASPTSTARVLKRIEHVRVRRRAGGMTDFFKTAEPHSV